MHQTEVFTDDRPLSHDEPMKTSPPALYQSTRLWSTNDLSQGAPSHSKAKRIIEKEMKYYKVENEFPHSQSYFIFVYTSTPWCSFPLKIKAASVNSGVIDNDQERH
jgi:hypothetical protein